jgi:dTDP-4-dehydrorhamnose 3,5-epimerase
MLTRVESSIPGCVILKPRVLPDSRGKFVKIHNAEQFGELGLETVFMEEYYSISNRGVLRGLHFQLPPYDHVKCVTCLQGKILDVVVDLRTNSPTYKQHFKVQLDDVECAMLYIPAGLAHGFYTLSEPAIFLNRTTTVYNAEADTGIRWNSCGIDWPNPDPLLSSKDKKMITLDKFKSPFDNEMI